MIETFFGTDALGTSRAFFAALFVGVAFGACLERAGFGSSRRLSGIFYFRDMAVVKVMFTALVTAMIGLSFVLGLGWIGADQLFFMPTVYGAQILGGLLFGVGFAMSGWCPGTGLVGLASGKVDALLFLIGALVGGIFFNECFSMIQPVYTWGSSGVLYVYESLGMGRAAFALLLTAAAIAFFWGSEYLERRRIGTGTYWNSPFLRAFSVALLVSAGSLFLLPHTGGELEAGARSGGTSATVSTEEKALLLDIERAADHMEPAELAERLMRGDPGLLLVDIRTEQEFRAFHIQGAVNIPLAELPQALAPHRQQGLIVLYSNGMTHPAQARDALFRMGYRNVYLLSDGLEGFIRTCLKPASLRSEPVSQETANAIQSWRRFFLGAGVASTAPTVENAVFPEAKLPGLLTTDWLAGNLQSSRLRILDLRTQPEYNTAHIPGSIFLNVESLRGMVNGVPSMLLPAQMLALHFSQMGIKPGDAVVLVYGEKPMDATLAAMACERLGHLTYGILAGGFPKWAGEGKAVDTLLPTVVPSRYPSREDDEFTVSYQEVLAWSRNGGAIILDVRPPDFFSGKKSDEARAGHIPGAVNRPFSEDIVKRDGVSEFKPLEDLDQAYRKIVPQKDARVVVHCRTGHQASQTFFVLKRLLGYQDVRYYDAGWTEWAARRELPVATD